MKKMNVIIETFTPKPHFSNIYSDELLEDIPNVACSYFVDPVGNNT